MVPGTMTITYRLPRRKPRRRPTLPTVASQGSAPPRRSRCPPDRTARILALAHHVDRLIESGELTDYADAARRFGLSRARITQVSNLLALSPSLQEALILQQRAIAERRLRSLIQHVAWPAQEDLFNGL